MAFVDDDQAVATEQFSGSVGVAGQRLQQGDVDDAAGAVAASTALADLPWFFGWLRAPLTPLATAQGAARRFARTRSFGPRARAGLAAFGLGGVVMGKVDVVGVPAELLAVELLERARSQGVELVGPGGLRAELTKRVLEAGLEAELTEHVGYAPHDPTGHHSDNSPNGTRSKTVITEIGPIDLATDKSEQ